MGSGSCNRWLPGNAQEQEVELRNGGGKHLRPLVKLRAPQEEADYYQHEAETGHYIVAVHSYGHSQEASHILYRAGAYDAQTSLTHNLHTVPLHEEVLTPHTRSVQVGSIIIRKEVITEEKTITVTVQREEVSIERRPLSPSDTRPGVTRASHWSNWRWAKRSGFLSA